MALHATLLPRDRIRAGNRCDVRPRSLCKAAGAPGHILPLDSQTPTLAQCLWIELGWRSLV